MQTAGMQRGPSGDNRGCYTVVIILLIVLLFKMCIGK
jgi:hypothetical protein